MRVWQGPVLFLTAAVPCLADLAAGVLSRDRKGLNPYAMFDPPPIPALWG